MDENTLDKGGYTYEQQTRGTVIPQIHLLIGQYAMQMPVMNFAMFPPLPSTFLEKEPKEAHSLEMAYFTQVSTNVLSTSAACSVRLGLERMDPNSTK